MFRSRLGYTRFTVGLIVALFAMLPAVTSGVASHLDRYVLPGNAVFPEGVAYDATTGNFYVGSTTDGTIFRGSLESEAAQPFLQAGGDGRTSALGLKVSNGRLYVSGGATGMLFVYDLSSGALLGKFNAGTPPQTFVNDVVVAPSGDAYFTDSFNPVLYRVSKNLTYEPFLNFNGTAITYKQGASLVENINLNGIAATPDGRYLIVGQTNTGKLFRITLADKTVREIDLGGQMLGTDGLLLEGHVLYAAANASELTTVQLSSDYATGTIASTYKDPSFIFPTTIARAQDDLLVVNSQFNAQGPGLSPALPFTVSSVPVQAVAPASTVGMPRTGGADYASYLWLAGIASLLIIVGTWLPTVIPRPNSRR